MVAPLAHDIALRIGLASRLLPEAGTRVLIDALLELMGEPITDGKLQKLRLSRLQAACRAGYAARQQRAPEAGVLQQVYWLLKGHGIQAVVAPEPVIESGVYCELYGSVRVACCSSGGENIDSAFGSCARFLVYQVSPHYVRLIDIREPASHPRKAERDAHRVNLVRDCTVLYTISLGTPAAAALVRAGLHPMRLAQAVSARDVLAKLQVVLGKPGKPPWLAKAMGEDRISSFNRQQPSIARINT